MACHLIMKWQNTGPVYLRLNHDAIGLVIACWHIVNALNNRPFSGEGIPELYHFILPLSEYIEHNFRAEINVESAPPRLQREEEEEEEEEGIEETDDPELPNPTEDGSTPLVANGLFFLRAIRLFDGGTDVPRFWHTAARLPIYAIQNLAQCKYAMVKNAINTAQPTGPTVPRWPGTNKTYAKGWEPGMDEEPEPLRFVFDAEQFPPLPKTNDGLADYDPDEEDAETFTMPVLLNKVWRSFLKNIMDKCARPSRGRPLWAIIPEGGVIMEDYYKTLQVTSRLRSFRFLASDSQEWDDNFHRIFPDNPNDKMYSTAQGWKVVDWIKDWRSMINGWDARAIKKTKAMLREKFDELSWLPLTRDERLWDARNSSKATRLRPMGNDCNLSPHIIINPRHRAKEVC